MSHTVELPALGESVTEGTVTRWLVAVGDTIAVDEPLVEVSTDKVDTEVPSPVAGTLLEIRIQEDEDAEVGQVLAIIGDASAAAPAPIKLAITTSRTKPNTRETSVIPLTIMPDFNNLLLKTNYSE